MKDNTLTLRVVYVDQKLGRNNRWNHKCPYDYGDLIKVKKDIIEDLKDQTHPRKYHYQEPIIDVVNVDENKGYWLSECQLRSYDIKGEERLQEILKQKYRGFSDSKNLIMTH